MWQIYHNKGREKEFIIAANECVERCIKKKVESGTELDEQALAICYSECGESNTIEKENSPDTSENANISQESLDNITEEKAIKKKQIGVTEDEYKKDTSHKPKKIKESQDMTRRNLFAEEKDEKDEAEDENKLDLTDRQEEYLKDKESKKSRAKRAEDEEKKAQRGNV